MIVQVGGNIVSIQVMSSGVGAALALNQAAAADAAAAEAARAEAVTAAGEAETAKDEAVAASVNKADLDGSNIVAPSTFAEAIGLGTADAPTFAGGTLQGTGTILSVKKADATAVMTVSTTETYSGTGTATLGAGRTHIGTLAPSGDDSALLIGRNISGSLLFSHGARDETEFLSTGASAYTADDYSVTYLTNGSPGTQYNHGYGGQWRSLMAAANGMDLFAGFVTFPRVSAGTVARLFHLHPQGLNLTGGAVTLQAGLYISPLAGAATNYGIYVEDNDNYFGGDCQFGGIINGASLIEGDNIHATGSISAFLVSGGIVMAKDGPYATIRAYADGAGSPASIKVIAAQLLVNGSSPVLGTNFEVVGSMGATSALVTNDTTSGNLNAVGAITTFTSTGGVLIAKPGTFGVIRAYSNGSGNPQTLNINPDAGQVLIGGPTNTTGKQLEVVGSISVSGDYYVDDVKVVSNQGAAVADATDAATAISQLNLVLARLRAHGLIAT